jgi:hypothetical protein
MAQTGNVPPIRMVVRIIAAQITVAVMRANLHNAVQPAGKMVQVEVVPIRTVPRKIAVFTKTANGDVKLRRAHKHQLAVLMIKMVILKKGTVSAPTTPKVNLRLVAHGAMDINAQVRVLVKNHEI